MSRNTEGNVSQYYTAACLIFEIIIDWQIVLFMIYFAFDIIRQIFIILSTIKVKFFHFFVAEGYIMGRAIARWIGFGVILSMLPFLLAIGFCRIVGLEVEQTEYIPDLLLVTFAIAVNALSSTTDGFKNKVLSAIFSILSLISMIICSCGYFFLFGGILIVNKIIIDFAYLEDLILPLFDNFNWDWIILAAVILLVLNALMGLISEGGKGWAQNAKNSPPNRTPPKNNTQKAKGNSRSGRNGRRHK